MEAAPYVLGTWIGAARAPARETAETAVGELLARSSERLVLELSRLTEVSDEVAALLASTIVEAQRRGRSVCLVRCSEELYARLQEAGAGGTVLHAGSLLAATQGLFGGSASTLDLHLRSDPQLLPRLRQVVTAVAREIGLTDDAAAGLKSAVNEAVANAILHGSPEGQRNQVRVSIHLEDGTLIVDVADQGGGFDVRAVVPGSPAALSEHGYGLQMIRRLVDRVEFFRDDRGMLVRLTLLLGQSAAPV